MSPGKSKNKTPVGLLTNPQDVQDFLTGLRPLPDKYDLKFEERMEKAKDEPDINDRIKDLRISTTMSCSLCQVSFADRTAQVRHYKDDLHLFNIKQQIAGKKPVVAGLCTNRDDLDTSFSSDENSDSDFSSDDGTERPHKRFRGNMATFVNQRGNIILLYNVVLESHMVELTDRAVVESRLTALPEQLNWTIILLSGGHFAAAVLQGETPIVHKTIHRYVVRAKQGKTQSAYDKRQGHPKSGGSDLRRYNEASLDEEVTKLLNSWREHLESSDRIFYHAPGNNRKLLVGREKALSKEDPRLRKVPFHTHKPTYREVIRVRSQLATIYLQDSAYSQRAEDTNRRKEPFSTPNFTGSSSKS